MKSLIKILFISLVIIINQSCETDDSSTGDTTVADLEIDVKANQITFKNKGLLIKPKITQLDGDKKLSYKWFITKNVENPEDAITELVSTEEEFVFKSDIVSGYSGLLKVSNGILERRAAFYVSVVSKYRYGLYILSKTPSGTDLSFKSLIDTNIPAEKAVFKNHNPVFQLGTTPLEMSSLFKYGFDGKGALFVSTANPNKLVNIDLDEMTVSLEPQYNGAGIAVEQMAKTPYGFSFLNCVVADDILSYVVHMGSVIPFLQNGLLPNYKIGKTLFLAENTKRGEGMIQYDTFNEKLMLYTFADHGYRNLVNNHFEDQEFLDMLTCENYLNTLIFTKHKTSGKLMLNYYSPLEDVLISSNEIDTTPMSEEMKTVIHPNEPTLYFTSNKSIHRFNYKSQNIDNGNIPFITINTGKIYQIKIDSKGEKLYVSYQGSSVDTGSIACYNATTGSLLFKEENIVGKVVQMEIVGF